MNTVLYYFSASGNSLATAKDIASRLKGDTEIRSIAAHKKEYTMETDVDRIGFIFPVYAWGIPQIVCRFIENLSIPSRSYLFAVITCGGTPGGTAGQLNKLLRKKERTLSTAFTVRHESGNLGMESPIINFVRKLAGKSCQNWSDRTDEICNSIEDRKKGLLEQNNLPTRLIGNFFASMASKMFASLDKNFSVTNTCNGCGICTQLCPVNNITLENNKPSWKHHCEQCLGCVQWCPQTAIEIGDASKGKPRYHNPKINLNEMIH